MVVNLIEVVGIIFAFMVAGFIFARRGTVRERDVQVFAEILFSLAIPALIFHSVLSSFERSILIESYPLPFFAMGMALGMMALAYGISVLIGFKNSAKRDLFVVSVAFSNTIFIGLPVITSLYGEATVAPIFLFELGHSLILWSIGITLLNNLPQMRLRQNIRHILNPPMITLVVALTLGWFGWSPGSFIMGLAEMLGQITTPLAIMVIGMTVGMMKLNRADFDPTIYLIAFLRLLVSPLLMGLLVVALGVPLMVQQVVTMEAAMPTMVTVALVARKYGKEYHYASMAIFMTTVLSLITIPLVAYLLELWVLP